MALSMPELSGLDVLPRLRAERVDSKVIVLTMHNDPKLATIARCEGAFGFLLKAWVNPARSHSNRSPCEIVLDTFAQLIIITE